MRPGIQEHVEISTKKKGTQSENEDGYELIRCTYSQTHVFMFLCFRECSNMTQHTKGTLFTWRNPVRVASPHRPGGTRSGWPAHIG